MQDREVPADDKAEELALFAGGGEMGERMAALDWARTPLGPPRHWPRSLKTCVRIILTSRQPMFVWWGDELINLYNDAYIDIVRGKHPSALAQPAREVWTEIWDQVGPRVHSAIELNEGTYDEALLLIMHRNGYPEETYYTFSYSPVPNDTGATGGIICANTDDTQRIIGARQMALLRELAARTAHALTTEDVCRCAAEALETDSKDLPFALVYLADADRRTASLMAATGIAAGTRVAPARVELGPESTWPFASTLRDAEGSVVIDAESLGEDLPRGAWQVPAARVLGVQFAASFSSRADPRAPTSDTGRAGVLVVGVNPFRLCDDAFRGFVGLVAGQLSASIARAEAFQQEKQRVEALAELDRAKTAFFSNISHEFRTPLTLMLGPLEDAMAEPGRTLASANLETTYRNALRLLKLVNTLLEFSRIEAGRSAASFEPCDLAQLTQDLASTFRSAIERAGLTFQVDTEALSQPIYVDRDMWEKIVLNLLSNALKFTFQGSISLRLSMVDDAAVLAISDTGIGIANEELPKVFTRFHRVHNARSRTHEGSGIGLALVHELVRLHGGSISVSSELGHGSTFHVRIPCGHAHLPRELIGERRAPHTAGRTAQPFVQEALRWLPPAVRELPSGADSSAHDELPQDLGTASILIADDNADMREYLVRLLSKRWNVRSVGNGREALEACESERPDLILSDVMMPELDGFGLLRRLRSTPELQAIPVIMLSARAGEESRIEGLQAGADDYLIKPFAARELIARVTTHLQIAHLRALAERERKRLYDVFVQAPVPVAVLVGTELRFEVANPAFEHMVGRDALSGRTVLASFAELSKHPVVGLVREVITTGRRFHAAEMCVPLVRDGALRELFFNFVAEPLSDADGRTTGIVVVAVEVTEQVQARIRVDALRQAAEDASRAKDDFLHTLSHELRTPLNAIIGWSSLLRRGDLTPERSARALETVERNGNVLLRLIEDMLDLSRIEQGKLMLSVSPIELSRVVEAASDAVRPAADAKNVRLSVQLDAHATIMGDADRLQQVAWNLLSNAIKFTGRGGNVQVRLARETAHVELTVADSGQGIDPAFLPHVFDRFRQADPSFTRRAGGLGLGLAIVRSLVELHGGTVTAHSDGPGSGSSFVVRLPVALVRTDSAAPEAARDASVAAMSGFDCPAELAGEHILVVDDEADTRELLRFLLEKCDARVDSAANAEEAVRKIQERRPALLVSDVGMPGMDGYALIQRVRALPGGGDIRALAITAYARGDDKQRALRAGFDMHLAKPVTPHEFLAAAAALLRKTQCE
jgi:signal transduction histidine kinase